VCGGGREGRGEVGRWGGGGGGGVGEGGGGVEGVGAPVVGRRLLFDHFTFSGFLVVSSRESVFPAHPPRQKKKKEKPLVNVGDTDYSPSRKYGESLLNHDPFHF